MTSRRRATATAGASTSSDAAIATPTATPTPTAAPINYDARVSRREHRGPAATTATPAQGGPSTAQVHGLQPHDTSSDGTEPEHLAMHLEVSIADFESDDTTVREIWRRISIVESTSAPDKARHMSAPVECGEWPRRPHSAQKSAGAHGKTKLEDSRMS